ncbi:MAG: hypothetical protein GY854_02785 [Deltaproteobacteria bacterium]|nr:hypothetical protein [Deltaproteobacteria bacterium]
MATLGATVAIAGPDVSLTCTVQDELQLFCFNPQEPAMAGEVNHNFLKVKEWMESKVGDVDANIDDVNITGDLSVNGNVTSDLSVNGNVISTGGYLEAMNLKTLTGSFAANGTWSNAFELTHGRTYLIFGTIGLSDHNKGSFVALAGKTHHEFLTNDHALTVISSIAGSGDAITDSNIRWENNSSFVELNFPTDAPYPNYHYNVTIISSSP